MKKFYLLILTAVMVSFSAQAITYNSITSNPLGLHFADNGYWQGGVAPPQPCIGCTINIYSDVTMDPADGTDIIVTNSTITVYSGVTMTIKTYLEFFNSSILIGSDATGAAGILLDDQVSLDALSTVRLANINTYINVNNDDGNPINGPYDDILNPGTKSAAIYQPVTPAQGGYNYTAVLTNYGLGSAQSGGQYTLDATYRINCDGSTPNTCLVGFVYGPAITQVDPAQPNAGTVFVGSTTLPVELVQFLASKNADGSVKIIWATAMEQNADKYEVERSGDKGSWLKIGTVAAKGNSTSTTNYTYTDRTPMAGTAFYRLKMIDIDGRFKYSGVAVVNSGADNTPLVIYRNPFVDQIRVKVNVQKSQTLTITVSDMLGKNYIRQTYNATTGDNLINLVPPNAATGMYVLKIHGSAYDQTVKLVKD